MVKIPENSENIVISIRFKDGNTIDRADIPQKPFDIPGFVAVWSGINGKILNVYPLDSILSMAMNFEDPKKK